MKMIHTRAILLHLVIYISHYNLITGHLNHWLNRMILDDNYKIFWNTTTDNNEIIFELHVQTLGFVGIGFSHGDIAKSNSMIDLVIGWITNDGIPHLQVIFQIIYLLRLMYFCFFHFTCDYVVYYIIKRTQDFIYLNRHKIEF